VLTAVVMNSSIFWDITPCNPLKVTRRFEGTSPPSSESNKPSKKPAIKQAASRALAGNENNNLKSVVIYEYV
jgi:hypothetical protein